MEQQVTENGNDSTNDRNIEINIEEKGTTDTSVEEIVIEEEKADFVTRCKGLVVGIDCAYKGEPVGFINAIFAVTGISWVLFLVFLMVLCGTFNTILFKLQNETVSKGTGILPAMPYRAPFTQAMMNLTGRFFVCTLLYFIQELSGRFCTRRYIWYLCCRSKKKQVTSKSEETEIELLDLDPNIVIENVEIESEPQGEEDSETTENEEEVEEQEEELGEQVIETQEIEIKEEEEGGEDITTDNMDETLLPQSSFPPPEEKEKQTEQTNLEEEENDEKRELTPLAYILPAMVDCVGSLGVMALIYTYASVSQMLRGCNVVSTAILSIVFLKSDLYRYPHKMGGIFFIVIGLFTVGYSSLVEQDDGDVRHQPTNPLLGAIIVVLAEFCRSVKLIFDEKFLKAYKKDPLQVAGIVGFWGIPVQLVMLMIFYFFPGDNFGSFENFPASLVQAFSNPYLFLFIIMLIINVGLFNFSGNWITKHLSAVHRVTIEMLRNVNVWLFEIMRGRETFSFTQLIGFILLVLGTFMYNQVGFGVLCPWYLGCMKKWGKVRCKDCLCCLYGCIFGKKSTGDDMDEDDEGIIDEVEMEELPGEVVDNEVTITILGSEGEDSDDGEVEIGLVEEVKETGMKSEENEGEEKGEREEHTEEEVVGEENVEVEKSGEFSSEKDKET